MSGPEFNPADDVQPTKEEWEAYEAAQADTSLAHSCGFKAGVAITEYRLKCYLQEEDPPEEHDIAKFGCVCGRCYNALAGLEEFRHVPETRAMIGNSSREILLEAALKACLDVLPGLEVRSWPPGHEMKRKAIELARKALNQ